MSKTVLLEYGENPWQGEAQLDVLDDQDPLGIGRFQLVAGNTPSYNTICYFDRLLQTVTHIQAALEVNGYWSGSEPLIAVGSKHGNACGAAVGNDRWSVVERMLMGDPRAIHGGQIMTNFGFDAELASHLIHYGMPLDDEGRARRRLLDAIFAPSFGPDAVDLLKRKTGKCRLMANPALAELTRQSLDQAPRLRYVRGGRLRQQNYTFVLDLRMLKIESGRIPNDQIKQDICIAWGIGSTSNSNTITIVKNRQLRGNGTNQQSRIDAAELAVKKAKNGHHDLSGAVAYSDSFFIDPDAPLYLREMDVEHIMTSSGSINDAKVFDKCRECDGIKGLGVYTVPDKVARGFFAE